MDIQRPKTLHLDVAGEHRKFVEFAFVRTPVVVVFPLADKTLHVSKGSTIVPAGVAQFIWKADVGESSTKEGDSVVWHGDLEGGLGGHVTS